MPCVFPITEDQLMKEPFEEIIHEVEADESHAQILIKTNASSKTHEEAKKVIEGSGIRVLETRYLSSGWFVLTLDVGDMRNIALKLIELGFPDVKGINAAKSR
jgi:hypothetical protein